MNGKRIRCTCGRIYDPVKRKNICPDCGAEAKVATIAEPPTLPTPEKATSSIVEETPQKIPALTPTPLPIPINQRRLMMIGGGVFAIVLLLLMVRGCGGKDKVTQGDRTNPMATATPRGTTIIVIPPRGSGEAADLNAMIANAAAGTTVNVPPGLYRGGLIAARAVRIVGDTRTGGQVVIQSEGKECLSVRSSGVAVQNVQFICNGIGELPAISVAETADLDLDGCKIQTGTRLAIVASGNASIKAVGSTITAANGTAIRLDKQARANLTQCSFPNTRVGIEATNGATAELHSCAFERIGGNEARGAIMALAGDKTAVAADDCHFNENSVGIGVSQGASLTITNSFFKDNGASTARGSGASGLVSIRDQSHGTFSSVSFENNSEGVAMREGGILEMEKCQFIGCGGQQTRDVIPAYLPVSLADEKSTANVRNCAFINSTSYAVNVYRGATLNFEDSQITGSRSAGLVVGDRNSPPAHAEIKRSHFIGNATAIGVFGGSTANVEDSECKENQNGIIALDRQSQLKLTKTSILANKELGLYVHANAQATAIDCDIRDNAKGAQSGMQRKSAERGSLTLQNCRFGGNRTFGAGAYTQSELILNGCTFDGTDKTNIFKERGAIVQTDMPVAESSPEAESSPSSGQTNVRRTPPPHRKRDDNISRFLRRFRP